MIHSIDVQILSWIQQNLRSPFLDCAMPPLTYIGELGIVWIAIALFLIVCRKNRSCGVTVLIGLSAGVLVGNVFLKNLIARARPCWLDPSVTLLISSPADYSFPSGHTLSGFIAATILFRYDRKSGICAYILASLISFSRLYLYVHYPSDILGGIVLGILIGVVTDLLVRRFLPQIDHTE